MRRRCSAASALLALAVFVPLKAPAAAAGSRQPQGRHVSYAASDSVTFTDLAARVPLLRHHDASLEAGEDERRPHALTLPAGVARPRPAAAAGPASPLGPDANPPATSASFAGTMDGVATRGYTVIPPDTHGAAGPAHLVEVTNQDVEVFSKTGSSLLSQEIDTWWSGLGASGVFDPKVVYDAAAGRFIMTALSGARAASSSYLIAVSATSDPTGTWYRRRIDADATNAVWADYPALGYNGTWIVVSVNMFTVSTSGYVRADVLTIGKTDLYANGSTAPTVFSITDGTFTVVPAETDDPAVTTLEFVTEWNESSGGNGYLRLYEMTGSALVPSFAATALYPAGAPWSFRPSGGNDFLPQSGTAQLVQADDSRIQQVVQRGGSLWVAQTVFLPEGGSPTRAAVQWWQVDPATGGTTQFGRIDDASADTGYAYPSIAVNTARDVVVGFSRFSATTHPSAGYAFRYASDAPNLMRAPVTVKAGEATYVKRLSGTRNRWGDYSHVSVDPSDGSSFWSVQEYAATPGGGYDRWGTWWAQIAPNAGPAASVSPSSIDFGSVGTGQISAQRSVTITSTGQTDLIVGSAALSGANAAEFSIASNTCTAAALSPGASCAIALTMAPQTNGGKSATLTVSSNAPNSPHQIALSGTGVTPAPGVTITPATLAFGTRATGTTTTLGTTVLNSGTAPLVIGVATLTGSGAFTIASDTCSGFTVAVGAACTISASFSPVSQTSVTASITFTSNAAGSPHTIALTGTGTAPPPPVVFSPASLAFGSVEGGATSPERTVRLTNNDSVPLAISSLGITGPDAADFAISTPGCVGSTPAGGSCTFGVTFTPSALNARSATVIFGGTTVTYGLSGTGVDSTPPVTRFITTNGSIRFVNHVVSVGENRVEGTVMDSFSTIALVRVLFRSVTGSMLIRDVGPATLACNASRRSCTWSVTIPPTEGPYDVTAWSTDAAGNIERATAKIRIVSL